MKYKKIKDRYFIKFKKGEVKDKDSE